MKVILKKGKERLIKNRHPWIFSGAIEYADASDGSIVPLYTFDGDFISWGYYNSKSQIQYRMLTYENKKPDKDFFYSKISEAMNMRKYANLFNTTDAYRLVNSEGDYLPGLIVDVYNEVVVLQSLTAGIDTLKNLIVEILYKKVNPSCIYEKSDHESRKLEGLEKYEKVLYGKLPDEIIINENNIRYKVDIVEGQKTGFFLDQRDNRKLIKKIAHGKDVLNLFSYTGGFTINALKGGANKVVSVDSSQNALDMLNNNLKLNNIDLNDNRSIKMNAFEYVNQKLDFDLVICDPPAMAKSKNDVKNALKGYMDLNKKIINNMKPDSYLLTCSCSRFIDISEFQKVIFMATKNSGRSIKIIGKFLNCIDHPVNIFCPENEYLKSILLHIV